MLVRITSQPPPFQTFSLSARSLSIQPPSSRIIIRDTTIRRPLKRALIYQTPKSDIMSSKILFWGGFGIATRIWQLGIEQRPLLQKSKLWVYPFFAAVGGSFGYWLEGVESRQLRILAQRKEMLLAKRARRAEREAAELQVS